MLPAMEFQGNREIGGAAVTAGSCAPQACLHVIGGTTLVPASPTRSNSKQIHTSLAPLQSPQANKHSRGQAMLLLDAWLNAHHGLVP